MASLGAAVLELRTDLRPMAAGLKAGEAEVAASLKRQEAMVAEHTSRVGQMMSNAAVSSRSLSVGHGDDTASLSRSTEAMRAETAAAGGLAGAQRSVAREAAGEAESHARLTPRVVETAGAHRALKNDVEQAGYAFSGFAGRAGAAGRSLDIAARHAQIFKSAGLDYLAAGLVSGGVALVGYGTKVNITFDDIGKTIQRQTGLSRTATGQLLDDVKAVGQRAPESWQQIGEAVATEARLFGANNQQIKSNTDLFLAFAAASKMDVQPAITAVSNILRQFHPAGMDAVGVMDALVNLAQKSQRPLSDYVSVLSRYGPQLQAMGLAFPQVIGLMDAFSRAGITTSNMGRGLTTILQRATAAQKDNGKALQIAGAAHMSIAQILDVEVQRIEGAHSKQEALNIAIREFGGRLGPQMALALYGTKGGLEGLNTALGAGKGKTDDLAKAQRDTLGGQVKLLEHDFDLLASKVGLTSNGLKGIVGDISSVVRAISSIPKPILDFLVYGAAGGGAALLLARHTPLGGLASRALGLEAGGAASTALVGKSATGAAIASGPQTVAEERVGASQVTEMTVGTLIARSMIGGGGGGGLPTKGGAQAAEKDIGGAATRDAEQAAGRSAGAAETGIMGAVRSVGPKIGSLMGGVMRVGMVSAVAAGLGEVVSHVIGGQAGKAIGKATQWGGIGASIGLEVGGPAGAAIGGAIGVGVGLAVTLIHKHNYGRDITDAVFKDFGGRNVAPRLARSMEDELNKANSIVQQTQKAHPLDIQAVINPEQLMSPRALADLYAHARKAGHDGIDQMIQGWKQYRVPDASVMWSQFVDLTKKFPRGQVGGAMRIEAAQEMLAYTKELERQGKLPAGAYQRMLQNVQRQFPFFRSQLRSEAMASARAFTQGLTLAPAQQNVHRALNSITHDFQALGPVMDRTKGDFINKSGAVVQALQRIKNQGGPNAAAAAQDIARLQQSAARDFQTMQSQANQHLGQLWQFITHGSQQATTTAVSTVQDMMVQYKRAYDKGAIDSQTYWNGIKQNFQQGAQVVENQTDAKYSQLFTNLNTQYAHHEIDTATFNARKKSLFDQMATDENSALQKYTGQMLTAMEHSGSVTTQGVKAMIDQFNGIIGPLGGQKLKYPAGVELGDLASSVGSVSTQAPAGFHAAGGVLHVGATGTGGHDAVPMTVGGQDIRVGEGEKVVVFNRHQWPEANQRFADKGGLDGYFAQNRKPNYAPYSRGGVVRGLASGGQAIANAGKDGAGGYVWPYGPGITSGRVDEGWDMAGTGPIAAIGNAGPLQQGQPGWPGTGQGVYYQLKDGVRAGQYVYVYENVQRVKPLGYQPKAGEIIMNLLAGYPYLESGWSTSTGAPTAQTHYSEGQATAEGQDFMNFLMGLAHGQLIGGGGIGPGGISVPTMKAPKVKDGLLGDIIQRGFDADTKEMNKALQKFAAQASGGFGTPTGLSGPAENQIYQAAIKLGFNKVGAAGLIGNAMQESSMNPSMEDSGNRGLFSWTPADPGYDKVQLGNIGQQIALVASEIGQAGIGAMNAAGSGSAAAQWFDDHFEKSGIKGNRFAYADQAFAQGYALGGLLALAGGGGPIHGDKPSNIQAAYEQVGGKKLKQSQVAYIQKYEKAHKGHPPSRAQLHRHRIMRKPPKKFDPNIIGTFAGATSLNRRRYAPGHNPFSLHDIDPVNRTIGELIKLVGGGDTGGGFGAGGDADAMDKLIQEKTNLYSSGLYDAPNFSSWNAPADFVITQDARTGQQVTPYISPNINVVGQQLLEILGYQNRWVSDLQGGLTLVNGLSPAVRNAIVYRQKQAAAILKKVRDNLTVKANMKKLVDLQKKVRAERKKKAKANRGAIQGWTREMAKIRSENDNLLGIKIKKNEASAYDNDDANSRELQADWAEWTKVDGQNMGFVGATDSIPSTPGGELGEINAQLGAAKQGTAIEQVTQGGTGASGLFQLLDLITDWYNQLAGPGGLIGSTTLQAQLYTRGLQQLAPGADVALSVAKASGGTSAHDQELIADLQQQLQQTQETLAVQTAESGVLSNANLGDLQSRLGLAYGGLLDALPAWGGSFNKEGVIPGPYGTPRLVEAHAGEEISWPSGGSDDNWELHVHVPESMAWLRDMMQTEVRKGGQTIRPRRPLPSGGGGVQRGAGLLT